MSDNWISAQKLGIPKTQFPYKMMSKKEEEQSMDPWVLLRRGNKNAHGKTYRDKMWSRD